MEIKVKNATRLTNRINLVKKQIIEKLENAIFNINELIEDIEEVEEIEVLNDIFENIDKMEDELLSAIDLI